MRILFVIQQLDFADHIAISYLSAIAKERGHETYFCSLRHSELTGLICMVSRIEPDIIAYSANIMGFKELVKANEEVQSFHRCLSIMGGPHATFSPNTFEESGMDIYCVGEGEYPFRDLLIRLEENKPWYDIENLITFGNTNPVRDLIENLDELPLADRDLVLNNSYLRETPKKTFYTTRGCMFSCSYCCNNYYQKLYKGKGQIFRRFSVERVIDEMERVKSKYIMDFVKIGDDLFSFKADEWLEEFAEKYPRRIGKPFNCYLRFDRVDKDVLALLKKAGCFSVNLSVDSTSKYVREKVLHRSMKDVDIVKELQKIKSFGINTFVNFMLAAPESTVEDDLNSIKVSREAKVTYVAYTTTEPMKGTQLYQYCIDKGYIDESFVGDMTKMFEKSPLSCFNAKEKNIRYNIFLLGCLVSKLPIGLYQLGMWVIKHIKPNRLFKWVRQQIYLYYIENKIFSFSTKAKEIRDEERA
jgi:radical SAM superfamily enzyme YgiQ (UPF0313 family)